MNWSSIGINLIGIKFYFSNLLTGKVDITFETLKILSRHFRPSIIAGVNLIFIINHFKWIQFLN